MSESLLCAKINQYTSTAVVAWGVCVEVVEMACVLALEQWLSAVLASTAVVNIRYQETQTKDTETVV